MSPSEIKRSMYWPRLSVMDFVTLRESMQTSFSGEHPVSGLGLSDLNFAINAPLDYRPPTNGALATLYFDQTDCARVLLENTYQIRCPHALNSCEFISLAEQAIDMIRLALMHNGIVGIDLMDLVNSLRANESRKLVIEIITYDDPIEVPWKALQQRRFKTLFAVLFAGLDLSLLSYSNLGSALEELNPNVVELKLATTASHKHPLPLLMLLGEPETSHPFTPPQFRP